MEGSQPKANVLRIPASLQQLFNRQLVVQYPFKKNINKEFNLNPNLRNDFFCLEMQKAKKYRDKRVRRLQELLQPGESFLSPDMVVNIQTARLSLGRYQLLYDEYIRYNILSTVNIISNYVD